MQTHDDIVNVLLVDDNPSNILTLEAALGGLGLRFLRAHSGREALRAVLRHELALILLDVNMPGMDGLETAALIRERRTFAQTPIIFVTATSDELQVSRGYALGAVDYVQRPFTPEVLRTKVGVFVELHRKNRQVRRQAETLQQRAAQLHKLAAASIAINSRLGVEEILRAVCEHAREIVGAHQAAVSTTLGPASSRARHVASVSARDAAVPGRRLDPDPPELVAMVRRAGHALRLSEAELRAGIPSASEESTALRGWLAAPLTGRDGTHLGLIQLSDRYEGDFTQDDESILVQLAQMAGIAVENALFARERDVNRAKDEFLATVSHELRTPLNAILGWSQLLAERAVPAERLAHGLAVIERNARAQATLVDDLLEAARMASGKLKVRRKQVSLREIIEAVVDGFRPQAAAKSIGLEVELEPEETYSLFGDPERLAQVVRNLLSNAVKFTPERGHVRVITRRSAARVRLVVSDDGCGIESQFLPHVFDRFRQADSTSSRRFGGLGIGLTIVRHIVEAHGGAVSVGSAGLGLGATFTVELPLLEVHPAGRRAGERGEQAAPALLGIRVMFVDDEDDTRELVMRMLETHGAQVQAFASAGAAIEAFDGSPPDVLVTDLALPGEDGFALLRRLRQRSRLGATLPAVALTAYTREEDRARTLACGFDLHVNKPVDAAEIVSAVASLAASRPGEGRERAPLRAARP